MDSALDRCPLLVDALRLLPVAPRREREELGLARHRAQLHGIARVRGVRVAAKDLDELFVQEVPGAPRLSPSGAKVLLDLFRQGALERIDGKLDGGIELLDAYAHGRASIVGPDYWKKPRRRRATVLATPRPMPRVTSNVSFDSRQEPRYGITAHRLT